MKKLLIIPLIVISTSLCAQKFQLGVKGGVNLANFAGSNSVNDVETKALLRFHAGAFLNLLFGDNFSLSPEVMFSSLGAKIKNAGQESNFKVGYVSVPVMLRYRFKGGFYLEAGPQVSFKATEADPDNTSVNDFANDLDLAIDAGLGYHSDMGLGVGARYVAGLSKIANADQQNDLLSPDYRNSVIQLSVFYTLFNNHRDKN